jgi:hypothetical protein
LAEAVSSDSTRTYGGRVGKRRQDQTRADKSRQKQTKADKSRREQTRKYLVLQALDECILLYHAFRPLLALFFQLLDGCCHVFGQLQLLLLEILARVVSVPGCRQRRIEAGTQGASGTRQARADTRR